MMDFAALRTQAMELLQREGRVAYRVLKLQLQIDDDLLDVLKDDLIYAKRLAVDEAGKILVGVGAPAAAQPDTRPQPEAERQLYTMLLAVTALLQREQRVTYRTLQYVFGVDEACLHAVRDELRFRQLPRRGGRPGARLDGGGPTACGHRCCPASHARHNHGAVRGLSTSTPASSRGTPTAARTDLSAGRGVVPPH